MRHENSVFHGLLKHVPWHRLDELVEKFGADDLARKLTTKRHLIALLYGQFTGATSLRAIVTGMASHETRLYHLGAAPVQKAFDGTRTPIAIDPGVFFATLRDNDRSGASRAEASELMRGGLIDSTTMRLSNLSADWARFSAGLCGVKAHIIYDPHADRPVYFAVTPSNVNDITAAKAMPIEPGATYVYDLGFYDFGWWAQIDDAQARFVTRLKKNTPLTVVRENKAARPATS